MRKIDTRGLSPEILAYLKSLEQKNQELTATVKAQAAELQQMNKLNELLVKTRHKMYGASSEQVQYLDAEQISFFNEAEKSYDGGAKEPTEATLVKGHARKAKRTKEELTKSLEHKKVLCELPEDERKCPVCGQEYLQIGEKFMRSELVVVPAQMYVLDYYCASYKCKACEDVTGETNILHANAPVSVMPKSMAAASTVAYIMQEKFQNGVPLYRQAEYWNGRGIDLKRNTMANWIIRSAKWFEPVWNLLRDELLSSNIVNADETDCHVLKEDGRESKQMSKMWVFCSPEKQIALYKYHPSRGGKVAQDMLKGFSGYLQSDGYSAYNAVENVTRVGCWAHARRKWVECFPKGVVVAGSCSEQAFGIIEKMFAIEKDWKSLSYEERLAQRKRRLKPLIEQYWAFLESFESEKDTNLYKAQQYSLNQRQYLDAILLDGRLELSNNLAERTVKPFVMARKNFLFSDTAKGAESSAHCFSVIETAKRNGLDVFGYLLFLLQELPKLGVHPSEEQLRPLLPWSTTLPDFCKKD
ncbi:MAG: IS66 family transposase [Faecalibacterium sp.]